MATRTSLLTTPEDKLAVVSWKLLLAGDSGEAVNVGRYADRTVQVTGTFSGGSSIQLQGSPDGVTWGRLHDAQGVLISIVDNNAVVIGDNPVFLRPLVVSGDGSASLNVWISAVMRSF